MPKSSFDRWVEENDAPIPDLVQASAALESTFRDLWGDIKTFSEIQLKGVSYKISARKLRATINPYLLSLFDQVWVPRIRDDVVCNAGLIVTDGVAKQYIISFNREFDDSHVQTIFDSQTVLGVKLQPLGWPKTQPLPQDLSDLATKLERSPMLGPKFGLLLAEAATDPDLIEGADLIGYAAFPDY